MQSGNLAQSADCTVVVRSADCMPCSLQTARPPFQWECFGEITSKKTENCHDFIVLYCVRNWEGVVVLDSVVENLVRHNNCSFRANKLVIVSPNYKQESE